MPEIIINTGENKAYAALVYTADVSPLLDKEVYEKVLSKVGSYRRGRVSSLKFESDRVLSLGAEFLLTMACEDFGISYAQKKIVTDDNSKPFFEDGCINFNLSHSGTKAMCVMSALQCGCDTEQIKNAIINIAKRFFSQNESGKLMSIESDAERDNFFYRIWTLKESFIKCTGFGLKKPLSSFEFKISEQEARLVGTEEDSLYRFYEKDLGDGYRYAVCLKCPGNQNEYSVDLQWKDVKII